MRKISPKVNGIDFLQGPVFNISQDELENVCESAGFVLDLEGGPDNNKFMLAQSIAQYVSEGNYYQDSGIPNAYTLTRFGTLKNIKEYKKGVEVTFKTTNPNTGNATVNVANLGIKKIVDEAGSLLIGGEIGAVNTIMYEPNFDGGAGAFFIPNFMLPSAWWTREQAVVAFVSADTFTVVGDKTTTYTAGLAIKLTQTSDATGYVSSSVAGGGLTTITVHGVTVDSGLTVVEYGQPVNATPFIDTQRMIVRHQEASGVGSGTFSTGAWRTRTINTVTINTIVGASLGGSQIVLPKGDYFIIAFLSAWGVGQNLGRLHNITDAADVLFGSSEFANPTNPTGTHSIIQGEFTLSATKILQIQHYGAVTMLNGFGSPTGYGPENYLTAFFKKYK